MPGMFDDPKDEMPKAPKMESEGDGSYIDDIMGEDIEGGEEGESPFGKEDPLEEALVSAGFKLDPAALEQVRAIVEKAKAPAMEPKGKLPGAEKPGGLDLGLGGGGKPPMGGAAAPAGMKLGDIAR